jgi:hypothetical protein
MKTARCAWGVLAVVVLLGAPAVYSSFPKVIARDIGSPRPPVRIIADIGSPRPPVRVTTADIGSPRPPVQVMADIGSPRPPADVTGSIAA